MQRQIRKKIKIKKMVRQCWWCCWKWKLYPLSLSATINSLTGEKKRGSLGLCIYHWYHALSLAVSLSLSGIWWETITHINSNFNRWMWAWFSPIGSVLCWFFFLFFIIIFFIINYFYLWGIICIVFLLLVQPNQIVRNFLSVFVSMICYR